MNCFTLIWVSSQNGYLYAFSPTTLVPVHKVYLGSRLDGSSSRNMIRHAIGEFCTVVNQSGPQEVSRSSRLPSVELIQAKKNYLLAPQDMKQIGKYQHEIEAGQTQMDQAVTLQDMIRPQYESALADYQSAENDLKSLFSIKSSPNAIIDQNEL